MVLLGAGVALAALPHALCGNDTPYWVAAHNQGNLQLLLTNDGRFGMSGPGLDPYTGEPVRGCTYPKGSGNHYLYGEFNIGAVADGDTLVSNTWELVFDSLPFGGFRGSTTDPGKSYYDPEARSDLDLICVYYDTVPSAVGPPDWDARGHVPLGLIIEQRTMAWSGASVDDFVIFEYSIVNMGRADLHHLWVCLDCFAGVGMDTADGLDNLTGLVRDAGYTDVCWIPDTVVVACGYDNLGNPEPSGYPPNAPLATVGLMLLGGSADSLAVNYNWWVSRPDGQSWGPRLRGTGTDPFRTIGPGLGEPLKDANMYYVMRHPELDYDQLFTAVDHTSTDWLPPPADAASIASGWSASFLFSFGPFELPRRERISFATALVGGDNVHHDPSMTFHPDLPEPFYDQLDFSELIENARWAKKVYDTPGFDTDGDGYRGEFRICEGDTVWHKGDGVPDFKADSPPPAPFTRYITEEGKIIVRWNGYFSETTSDVFSGLVDFEGYNVYAGLDDRRGSLSILSSYDRLNFKRFFFRDVPEGQSRWESTEPPFSLDSLRIIYNDPEFDPLRYTRIRPLIYNDSAYYFEEVAHNQYDLGSMRGIHKVYPDATDPGADSTLWTEDDITMDYGRPLPKFYEYEYIHDNILPTVPYFMSVTAFDFGFTGGRSTMPPQESNPLNNVTEVYALPSAELAEEEGLDVIVYPNPYRVDARYVEEGFENRKGNIIPDRARLIHFANLPRVCKISIFSLDGDLIGTIDHNYPEGGPEAMHDWWNLVSRSGLAVQTGLYYWVVESAKRTQIGKLVILK